VSAIAAGSLVGAVLIDALAGEPPRRIHPVALLGRWIAAVDDQYRHPTLAGVLILISGTAVFAGGYAVIGHLAVRLPPLGSALVIGTALSTLLSIRMLTDVAAAIDGAIGADLRCAREDIRALVGRDTTDASADALRSAVLESLAENLSDGFIATVLAFTIGASISPVVGLSTAATVKAVNTYDSMIGYVDRPLGTPAARTDDLLQLVPSRVTALLLAVTSGRFRLLFDRRLWIHAKRPASPNSGWPMATYAAVSGVTLQKEGAYRLDPADTGIPPDATAVSSAIGLIRRTAIIVTAICVVILWF